ncbi:hypothetical protein Golob_023969, partial [Gossypium lobatum]|nr:hypothetical protein [Gossypium lobatum]
KKVSVRVQLLNRELVIEKRFLDKVEDNAAVEIWFKETQQEKGDSLTEGVKKRDVFALSIYRLVIFPKVLGYVNDAVSDLFNQLDKKVTPVPTILVETFRSLSACRRNHQDEDVEWRAHWMILDEILSRQLTPTTQGLAQCEFAYKVRDRKARLQKEEFGVGKKDRKVGRGKDSARIRRPPGWVKHRNNRGRKSKKKRVELISGKRNSKMLELRARVAELERSLHQYCCHNSVIELKASLTKIEELKGKIEELEATLQNCKLRVELLETNNKHWKEQL